MPYKANVSQQSALELAGRFGVSATPTVVFFDPQGRELQRFVGFVPPEEFLGYLDRAISESRAEGSGS